MTNDALEMLVAWPMWEWPDDARDTIADALQSVDEEERRIAADLAGQDLDEGLAAALLKVLKDDPSEIVRAAAAISFGPLLDEWDDASILGELVEDPPLAPDVVRDVIDTLEELYRDARTPILVRQRALEAAVRAPAPWQEGAVRAAYSSGKTEWRTTAVFCMGHLQGFDREILESLFDDDQGVVCEAIRAAGRRGIKAAGLGIMAFAASQDTDPTTRRIAAEALAHINPPRAEELLHELADHDDPRLAETAAWAIEERATFRVGEEPDDEDSW
jgi:hypothetical protein